MEEFLFKKDVDKSLLQYGVTIPKSLHPKVLGNLSKTFVKGDSQSITVMIDSVQYHAIINWVGFSKYDRDVLQIRYSEKSPIGQALCEVFSRSHVAINGAGTIGTDKEYLKIYTLGEDCFKFECFPLGKHDLGRFYSWEIVNETTAIKHCDKSFFEHSGSGIPKEICWFFDADSIVGAETRTIQLLYSGSEFSGRLATDSVGQGRVRIFWNSDLSKLFSEYQKDKNITATFHRIDKNKYEIQMKSGENNTKDVREYSGVWLLTWNPNNWDWLELDKAISDTHHGKRWQDSWSCISTHVKTGDRIFLTRLGTADNGILASGYAAGAPYEEAHWDEERAAEGKKARYIDINFDWIVDTDREPLLSQKLLQERFSDQKWNPQGSGIEIHSEYTADLEQLWEEIRLGGEEEMNPKEMIEHIKSYIASEGFSYVDGLIENFYLSLKSKPFVILAGTSGTGKTRLVKLFARAVGATTDNSRFKMVSVRPDWSDSTDLFGHVDLNGKFIPGAIIEFVKRAELDTGHPYFLCLDEMNLARVEYYLSDILSVMETRDLKNGQIVSDPLISVTYYGADRAAAGKYGTVRLPENLYLIGTVNMDETTFPFSRKVLDRANTIEFSFVDLMPQFEEDTLDFVEPLNLDNSFLKTEYLLLKQCAGEAESVNTYCSELQDINRILQKAGAHVGYRVRDEIVFYLLNNRKYGLLSENEAMDNELMQKILPRIQGSSLSVKEMLCNLFKHCAGDYDGYQTQSDDIYSKMEKVLQKSSPKFPCSAEKIAFMVRRFEEDGFTSYWL